MTLSQRHDALIRAMPCILKGGYSEVHHCLTGEGMKKHPLLIVPISPTVHRPKGAKTYTPSTEQEIEWLQETWHEMDKWWPGHTEAVRIALRNDPRIQKRMQTNSGRALRRILE